MTIPHKTFLLWLLYATLVTFATVALIYTGLPATILAVDHSHLTAVLLAVYVVAEIIGFRTVLSTSRENRTASAFADFVGNDPITGLRSEDGNLSVLAGERSMRVPNSIMKSHIVNLMRMARGGGKPDQTILLQALADERFSKTSGVGFLASRIVWLGILATIVGVVIAFWPFMATGFEVATIATKLGGFFSGIAVAFVPTLISFVFKIALDIVGRIIDQGNEELMLTVTRVCETAVIPYLTDDPR